VIHYHSLEVYCEWCAGSEADTWTLRCVIFEIRAGYSFFEPFLSDTDVLMQNVKTLGRLPDSLWSALGE
jgi:serine/threonine-protein kinase SRPK3